jgi:hypothetical protein
MAIVRFQAPIPKGSLRPGAEIRSQRIAAPGTAGSLGNLPDSLRKQLGHCRHWPSSLDLWSMAALRHVRLWQQRTWKRRSRHRDYRYSSGCKAKKPTLRAMPETRPLRSSVFALLKKLNPAAAGLIKSRWRIRQTCFLRLAARHTTASPASIRA